MSNFDKFKQDKETGKDFSGRSSIQPLDLLDSIKKQFCEFFAMQPLPVPELTNRAKSFSEVEMKAVVKYRAERLTLERLGELYSNFTESKKVHELKEYLMTAIASNSEFSKLFDNRVQMLIINRQHQILTLDFLVTSVEKLDLLNKSNAIATSVGQALNLGG